VDEWIIKEIHNKQKEILPAIQPELDQSIFFELIDRNELKRRKLISVYEAQLQDMEFLFLPQDRGEKHAIALAQATGARFLLSDDEKQDGPYWSIDRGIIDNLEVLGFWDLIYLNILTGNISDFNKAHAIYCQVCQHGYYPPYAAGFGARMKMAIRRSKDKQWFKDWCSECGIHNKVSRDLLIIIKENDW
jgi:predicted nucleic acid-binding protein